MLATLGAVLGAQAAAPSVSTRAVILPPFPFACDMNAEGAEPTVYCWEGEPNVKRHARLGADGEVSQTRTEPLPQGIGGPGDPYGIWRDVGPFRCEVLREGMECVVIATGHGFLMARNRIVEVDTPAGIVEPAPEFAKAATFEPTSGVVWIKQPGEKFKRLLSTGAKLPFGTLVDVRRGTVKLTAAAGPEGGVQSGLFRGGQFRVTQEAGASKAPDGSSVVGLTVLKLAGPPPSCGARASALGARAKSNGPRRLWGDAHGNFQTGGKYGSATVGGTKWLTEDSCQGTKVKVVRGVVTVEDFETHRTVTVSAGHTYLASSGLSTKPKRKRIAGVWMTGPGCDPGGEWKQHPAGFPFTCDPNAWVEKAHWSNWGKPTATASAIYNLALVNGHNSVATAPRKLTPSTVIASHIKICDGRRYYSSVVIKTHRPQPDGNSRFPLGVYCPPE